VRPEARQPRWRQGHPLRLGGRLYEAPYARFSAQGADGVFPGAKVDALIGVPKEIEVRAA